MAEAPLSQSPSSPATPRARAGRLAWIGGIGAAVTALCCFTPLLVVALSALGLVTLTGYLDWVLLPLLAAFLALGAVGLLRRRREACRAGAPRES